MRVDTNTNGHRQWFYFRVRNGYAGIVRFNIFRFKKKFSLFQRGMKPYVLSVKSKKGWQPACTKIQYKTQKPLNDYNKSQNESPSYYLTFQYKFQQAQDEVYFASGLPYTVSFLGKRLTEFKQKIKQIKNQKIQYQISEIGKSLCGQKLPLVTICGKYEREDGNQRKTGEDKYNYIIINARTHAGQTASSWVLDGFLEKIVKDQAIKDWIFENRICFKIVPMLNPDGVFVGNYRTGVLGDDFNRKFASGKKDLFPQIFALKKLISECKRLGKVFLFLDLHGHSILKNSFIYGPSETLFTTHPLRNLPFSIWHNSKYFRLSSCKFKFSKDMAQTARIYFQIKQNILTYTCQTSLGLYYQGTNTIQMVQSDYQSLGSGIVQSIFQLLTKEKIQNYKEHEEITTVAQKNMEFNQTYNDNKLLPKYFSKPKDKDKEKQKQKQLESRTTLSTKRQKLRQTCLQKIKTIKKQLNQQSKQQQIIAKQIEKADRLATKKLAQTLLPQPITKIFGEDNQTQKSTPKSYLHSHHNSFQLYSTQPNQNQQKQQVQPQASHQPQLSPQPQPQLTSSPTKQKISHPHPHLKIKNKNTKQAQFKIRRKSDVLKIIPESIRKKLGIRIQFSLLSTKHMGFDYGSYDPTGKDTGGVATGMATRDGKHLRKGSGNGADTAEEEFRFQRSATYDSSYLSTQIQAIRQKEDEMPNLQMINQKFSQQYQSMNDSDGSSCDLEYKQKQYLIQCIKNTKKTNPDLNPPFPQQQPEFSHPTNPNAPPPFSNINGFKQIRFKSIDAPQKNSILPFRSTKRQPHKFRDLTHKSLGRNLYDEDNGLMAQMVQKKQLNQRGSGGQGNGGNARKIGREPYFLVQIKNKNCESLGIGVTK